MSFGDTIFAWDTRVSGWRTGRDTTGFGLADGSGHHWFLARSAQFFFFRGPNLKASFKILRREYAESSRKYMFLHFILVRNGIHGINARANVWGSPGAAQFTAVARVAALAFPMHALDTRIPTRDPNGA